MTKQQTRAVTTIMDVAVNVAMGTIELRTIGALIIRLRFWAHCTIIIIKNPQNNGVSIQTPILPLAPVALDPGALSFLITSEVCFRRVLGWREHFVAVCPGCRGRLSAVYGRARKESDPNRGLVRLFFEPSCLLAVASRLPSLVEGVWDNTAGL